MRCFNRSGSGPRINCPGGPGRSSSQTRRSYATTWSCRTGRSTQSSRLTPSHSRTPPARKASSSPGLTLRSPSPRRNPNVPKPNDEKKEYTMRTMVIGLAVVVVMVLSCSPAGAWSHAGAYGGSTSHSYGSTSHTNAYGGSATHTAGQGTTATNRYGDTATHQEGSGSTTMTNPYGGSATHYAGAGTTATTAYGATAYHPPAPYYPYHPPTTVAVYGSSCSNCGGWSTAGAAAAGAAVGVVAGVAIASSNTAAATSNAYNAGVVAGATYGMGAIYPTLPPGCITPNVGGATYYLCGNAWFQPSYGANGVYYRVIPTPIP